MPARSRRSLNLRQQHGHSSQQPVSHHQPQASSFTNQQPPAHSLPPPALLRCRASSLQQQRQRPATLTTLVTRWRQRLWHSLCSPRRLCGAASFTGPRPGFCFQNGPFGLGYYKGSPPPAQPAGPAPTAAGASPTAPPAAQPVGQAVCNGVSTAAAAAASASAAVAWWSTEAATEPSAAGAPSTEAAEDAELAAVAAVADGGDAEPSTDDEMQVKSAKLCASNARAEYKCEFPRFMRTHRPSNNLP